MKLMPMGMPSTFAAGTLMMGYPGRHGHAHASTEILSYIELEVVEQHHELAIGRREAEVVRRIIKINHGGAGIGYRLDGCIECCYHLRGRAINALPRHAQACTPEASRIQKRRVVGGKGWTALARKRCRRRTSGAASLPAQRDTAGCEIAWIGSAADDETESGSCIGHGTGVRPHRILGVGDGNYAAAADQPDRGFNPYNPVDICRTNNAAIGFATQGHRGEVSRRSRSRPRAGATGVAIKRVWVVNQAAAS